MEVRGWTEEEIEFVKNNHEECSVAEISKHVGKSLRQIEYVKSLLGIKHKNARPFAEWEETDLSYLKDNFGKISIHRMAKYIDKPISSVRVKLVKMGLLTKVRDLNFWKDEELDYIKTNYDNMTCCDIAKHLGTSTQRVNVKVIRLGLNKIPLTLEQHKFLTGNMSTMTTDEIALKIGRNRTVVRIAKRMIVPIKKIEHIAKSRGRKRISAEAVRIIVTFSDKLPLNELAEKAGVSCSTVEKRIKQYGLSRYVRPKESAATLRFRKERERRATAAKKLANQTDKPRFVNSLNETLYDIERSQHKIK